MKILESGSPKKDCKTLRISVHRHYILNVQRKGDKRDWPITRPRSSRKFLSQILLAIKCCPGCFDR
jgi:hypothetical protein